MAKETEADKSLSRAQSSPLEILVPRTKVAVEGNETLLPGLHLTAGTNTGQKD